MDLPGAGNTQRALRRRRTRRHRRNRFFRRAALITVLAGLSLALASVALRYLSPSLARQEAKSVEPEQRSIDASANLLALTQQETSRTVEDRPVYPYSVVPGGVKDARELKWVAEHDPVVAAHYAGFDYEHARLVRLVLARTAFVSYRIGNRVYWTRHRVSLKKGETVITDGKITARTRCGNRVEEVPQQATSSSEPPAAKFEEPVHPSTGTAVENPPVPFQSALLNRQGAPGLGPAPPLSLYDPFGPGVWIPIAPPPLPGLCGPEKKKGPVVVSGGKKKVGNPCGTGGGGGGTVPEPSTWLLFASGLAAVYWAVYRKTRRSVARS